jgi:alpha-tubulin suppressor-like RCC1 family protein/uncharacterized protein YjdB
MRRFAFAAAAALLAACGGDSPVTPPPSVASIQVTPGQDTLVALGRTRQFSAAPLDAQGHPVSGVTVVWRSSNPSVATVDSVTGVATAVGNGLSQISAVVGAVAGQATLAVSQVVATVTVTPGSAGLSTVGVTQAFSAVARDSANATVAGVRFVWQSSDPSVAIVDSTGLAKSKGPGQTTITASGRGIPGSASLTVTQTPATLAFSVGPSAVVAGEAINPAIEVEVRDASGNVVAGSRAAITLAFGANPGGATLHGSTIVNAVGGIATFSGITVETADSGYTLAASSAGMGGGTSGAFDVAPAAPKALQFVVTSVSDTAGQAVPFSIRAVDRFGNFTPSAVGAVILRLSTNPTGATLINANFFPAMSGGVADLSILSVRKAGVGYRLEATGTGGVASLDSAYSPLFDVIPGTPILLQFAQQPGISFLGSNLLNSIVRPIDEYNNPTGTAETVTLTLGVNPWGGALSGTTTRNGTPQVTFDSLRVTKPGLFLTLVASASGLGNAITGPFNLWLSTYTAGVAVGANHACTILAPNSNVACWGSNSSGQLGNPGAGDSVPVLMPGTLTFTTLAAGDLHTCGLTPAGAAYCWGDNASGQLGNAGAGATSTTPVAVDGGHQFIAIAGGGSHTCALATDSTAYCWGADGTGQLGDSGKAGASTTTPTPVYGGRKWRVIAAGSKHTCAIGVDSLPRCWGDDSFGQLGDSALTTGGSDTAVLVRTALKFRAIGAGANHTCAVAFTQAPFCWGRNNHGQLGNTNLGVDADKPVAVTATSSSLGPIVAGGDHTCASYFGTVRCWGSNALGEVGTGTAPADADHPLTVSSSGAAGDLAASANGTCAIFSSLTGYRVNCWGGNASGQVGDGTRVNRSLPTVVREQQ